MGARYPSARPRPHQSWRQCIACQVSRTNTEQATTERLTSDLEARIVRLYPLGLLGLPEDVAKVVTFLASDGASHITGQTLSVSGGYTMV